MKEKKTLSKRTLLYEEVVKELYKLIDEDQIKPGEKLPAERELKEIWGVSRNVLREAFHVLESRGLITSSQGKGRVLRALPNQENANTKYEHLSKNLERCSLLDAYELRKMLEPKVMELIVQKANDKDLNDIEEEFYKVRANFKKFNKTVGELDMHRIYASKAGSPFLEQILEIIFTANIELMHNNFIDIYAAQNPESTIAAHENIVRALKERNHVEAQKHMLMHLEETINML